MTDDISGWRPDFGDADRQLQRQASRLRSLVGSRIVRTWTVHFADGEWFDDLPVVLQLQDGRQPEVCWQKTDDLSITWGTIDVAVSPGPSWDGAALLWRSDHESALRSVVGSTIEEVLAVGWTETAGRRWFRRPSARTYGLWLGTGSGGVLVFNALDTNGVASRHPATDPRHRCRPV